MHTLIVVIHVIVCIGLVAAILLHSGRGTGLTASFGGSTSAFSGSSLIEKNLDRITIGLAIIFVFTSITLAFFF
ncbi:preprotein translocase subunit SecG [Candidatus Oleimmundimicrobium sp.]|uniref:preprotein translocase subunit SecG n=1 Tax=Candidatus Oleimmundimicrobium sp. TaxID=3060597 RepID=UPI002720CCCC|nr:preprotein translocase subunit SecG [Candidatus Oleimmundimicrobium sp.]MDO8885286.1 preprotein translocase subunit SecG [Candidatus Oleimmundimicrobium sp.]